MTSVGSIHRTLFTALGHDRGWSARDVLDWAEFAGLLSTAWPRFLHGVEMRETAAIAGKVVEEETIQTLVEEFRYRYDLITVEETEKWLEARMISMESFLHHLERLHWLTQSPVEQSAAIPYARAASELRELFCIETTLSGELDQFAKDCSRRVVSLLRGPHPTAADVVDSLRSQFHQRHRLSDGEVADWLEALGRDTTWLEAQLRQEEAYLAVCGGWLTSENRQSLVRSQRLSLMGIQLERMTLATLDAAREACLCVRVDGRSIAELASECGQPFDTSRFLLGTLPAEQQARLLSLSPGETMGPDPVQEGFQFSRLVSKEEPALSNPEVAAAVDARILEARFADLSAGLLQWELADSSPA